MSGAVAGHEHTAKHEITEWLEGHGATVWWEETNEWDHQQFEVVHAGDGGGVPDLIVKSNGYALVIEFKPGDSVGQLYDALIQLHGYWTEFVTGGVEYRVDGRSVEPDGFLTASKNSRFGRLFPPYVDDEPDRLDDFDEGRRSCYRYGHLPPAEFRMTEQHVRTLWRLAKRSEQQRGVANTPHIGALLSEHLEREQLDPTPAILWNRGQTNQDWEVLE